VSSFGHKAVVVTITCKDYTIRCNGFTTMSLFGQKMMAICDV